MGEKKLVKHMDKHLKPITYIKSQVIIETIVGLLVLLALLIGVTKMFLYFSSSMAQRNAAYESTRNIGVRQVQVGSCTMSNPNYDIGSWGSFSCTGGDLGSKTVDPSNGLQSTIGTDYEQYMVNGGFNSTGTNCSCHYKCDWFGCCIISGCSYEDSPCGNSLSSAWAIQYCTFTNPIAFIHSSGGINPEDVQNFNYTPPAPSF